MGHTHPLVETATPPRAWSAAAPVICSIVSDAQSLIAQVEHAVGYRPAR